MKKLYDQMITSISCFCCKPTAPDDESSTMSGGNDSQKPISPSDPKITKGGEK